ncbi:MAG: M24B family metallopeptidase, partial [Bdellovibrionales bacterium]
EAHKGDLTEMIVDRKLHECRNETNVLQDLSFEAIVGWAENGAVVHYRVSEESSLPIKGQGLLLIDSGGQYLDGTTDVTRTIALGGAPTAEQKRNFTLVLKGHIGVATAIFPEGTTGAQIDVLARKALWEAGLDYGHGTGHGVGCYLSVHEEATYIAPRSYEVFKPGMVVSNEPGYYKENEYGIRIESLVVVVETGKTLDDGRKLLGFETITMVPLDEKLIDWDILTNDEIQWVKDYQETVEKALA